MRITITLEDDVAASLKRLAKARRLKFNALINLVLREGIESNDGLSEEPPRVPDAFGRSRVLPDCKCGQYY
jgi:hypothetical protein